VVADLFASVVVFLVALPLCIGIATASGMSPEAGIVTGIVGGILVGTLAGSPLQVSGPAARLIVLVFTFLDDARAAGFDGSRAFALLGLALMLAGLMQMAAGACRLGVWFRAVSPAVVDGMLAGIGVTIIAKQFHVMVDDDPPKQIVDGLLTIPSAVWKGFTQPPGSSDNHSAAALIGLLTIVTLVGWKLIVPKKLKFIPAAVVAVVSAVLLNEFGRPLLDAVGFPHGPAVDRHGGIGVERVSVSSNLLAGLTPVWDHWLGWEVFGSGLVWKGAITFALIASAETMLCAVAVDSLHTGPRAKFDRELAAQGVGNVVCGVLGALPMTGVIVRSSANVEAGAQTRLSTILHGVWLLGFVMLLPGLLSRIPLAALAAVLVYTGWKLVNLPGVFRLWKVSRGEVLVWAATAGCIVAFDLLTGVIVGIVLSAARLLWMFSALSLTREDEGSRTHLHLAGAATFLRLPAIAAELDKVPPGQAVHVHLDKVWLVDHAVMTLLSTFQKQHESKGGRLYIDWDRLHARFHTPRVTGREIAPRPGPFESPTAPTDDHLLKK
jgi:MFS superfamily sulfate permease-like transporter